jgi:hypothetical protein
MFLLLFNILIMSPYIWVVVIPVVITFSLHMDVRRGYAVGVRNDRKGRFIIIILDTIGKDAYIIVTIHHKVVCCIRHIVTRCDWCWSSVTVTFGE